jgi:hypothetical protein
MNIDHAISIMKDRRGALPAAGGRLTELLLLPLLTWLAVRQEPALTQLSRTHEAMLPLATMLLLAALLHPRLRHYLVVALCYGVAFLALHDVARVAQVPLPPALNYDWVDMMRPVGLWLVAALAAVSGIAESLFPGRVWARRCYFAAAALYFTGVAVMGYAWTHSWQSMVLGITGITAIVGCALAHRIVAAEAQMEDDVASDEMEQQAREAMHQRTLQSKEWRDNLLSIIDECEALPSPASMDVSHPA